MSLLGELDYYDDISGNLEGGKKFVFFFSHVLWTMVSVIVLMNIFMTIAMDAYADAKEVEDKKVELAEAQGDKEHVESRLAAGRLKLAKNTTIRNLREQSRNQRASNLTAVVPGTPLPPSPNGGDNVEKRSTFKSFMPPNFSKEESKQGASFVPPSL
jgi:hypothetical protein